MNTKLILALAVSISLSACATVTKGSNDTVFMTSQPSEAKVVFEDTTLKYQPKSCVTPCEIELNRKRTYNATVSKAGYEDFVVVMVPKVSTSGGTAMAGNLLLGGVIGAGVDGLTGAMKDLTNNNLDVILGPTGGESYAMDKNNQRVDNMKARAVSGVVAAGIEKAGPVADDKAPET